ncbi:6983_t:CDS:2 [Racocetra persica]|uniref:6983_t:CDS:1 n=1 Tax=Racocetra persica TaxID=160502 RepID=A0ACA9KAH5_9GLOM|nr:6983_t:CDS:2 [Racocetra persica]
MEVLEKDEKSRNKLVGIIGEIKELAKGTVKIGSTATNLAKAGKSVKLFRETNNLQKITQAALPELNVVANVRTASTQESLKELDEIIESLKKDLENLETRQLEAQIEVSSEWNCRVM